MASSEMDFLGSLETLKVTQNTTALQIKPDKCMKGIVWFLAWACSHQLLLSSLRAG